jgi:hypothetical protein
MGFNRYCSKGGVIGIVRKGLGHRRRGLIDRGLIDIEGVNRAWKEGVHRSRKGVCTCAQAVLGHFAGPVLREQRQLGGAAGTPRQPHDQGISRGAGARFEHPVEVVLIIFLLPNREITRQRLDRLVAKLLLHGPILEHASGRHGAEGERGDQELHHGKWGRSIGGGRGSCVVRG